MEDIVGTEILAQILYDNRKIAASGRRRETQVKTAGVFQIHFQPLQPFQLFDAALNLYSLGRLIAEAFNEFLRVLNHLLLVLIGSHLLFMPLLAQLNEFAVIDVVIVYPAKCNLNCTVAYIVNKRAVVTNHKHGAWATFQKILQPLDGLDVKMVRRLVQ